MALLPGRHLPSYHRYKINLANCLKCNYATAALECENLDKRRIVINKYSLVIDCASSGGMLEGDRMSTLHSFALCGEQL